MIKVVKVGELHETYNRGKIFRLLLALIHYHFQARITHYLGSYLLKQLLAIMVDEKSLAIRAWMVNAKSFAC